VIGVLHFLDCVPVKDKEFPDVKSFCSMVRPINNFWLRPKIPWIKKREPVQHGEHALNLFSMYSKTSSTTNNLQNLIYIYTY